MRSALFFIWYRLYGFAVRNPSTPTTISHSVSEWFFVLYLCGNCIKDVEQMTFVIPLLCNVCLAKRACHATITKQVAYSNALHPCIAHCVCLCLLPHYSPVASAVEALYPPTQEYYVQVDRVLLQLWRLGNTQQRCCTTIYNIA